MALSDAAEANRTTGQPLSQLNTGAALQKKLDTLMRGRELIERQWKLNLAFYRGRQYSYYSKASRQITSLPVDDGDKPRYRVRIVSNQIVSGAQSLLAKYLKTKPQQHATPGTGSDEDLRAAQLSEKLLEFWWEEFGLDDNLEEVLLWAIIGGQGYWKICWDEHAGKQMSFLLDPNGQPIMDEALKQMFSQQLEQAGIPPQEQTVYMGDIRVEVISPFDLYIDPTVKKFSDAKYVVQSFYMDPDEVKARYKQDLPADSVPSSPDAAIPMGGAENAETLVVRINCMYIKPNAAVPKGRIVTWASSSKKILEDKPWDYPTNKLPFVKFPGLRVPGEVYDSSVVEHAIPLQKELNRTLSQIVEFKNLGVKPQWFAPAGSLRQRRTDEPGAIFEYNPINGMQPEPIPVPGLPAYVFEHLQDIQARLADTFGRMEVSEGGVPPNVEAGVAIDLLQEMAADKIAPQIRLIEMAIADAGQQMLELAKVYYIEPRLLKIGGTASSQQIKQFTKADIAGNVSVHVEAGSGLPRTRAGRQARIESFIQMGLLRPDQAFKYLDVADLHGIGDQFEQDEDQAYREHELLNGGQPVNTYAVIEAQQQIQQMQEQIMEFMQQGQQPGEGPPMNPDTGQPFNDPEDFQEWASQTMHKAMVAPGVVDNHEVHLDVHSRIIKGFGFVALPPEIQQAYIDHVNAHREILFSFPKNPAPVAPKVSLQLKSTVGPTVQSEILKQAGVMTNPDENSEPPLETWVSEQVPPGFNTDGSPEQNAAPIMGELLQTQAEVAQGDYELSHAKAIATANAAADMVDRHTTAQQSHDLHEQKLRAASAQADAAEAKAKLAARPPSKGKG
jgi:hypothetical protein